VIIQKERTRRGGKVVEKGKPGGKEKELDRYILDEMVKKKQRKLWGE